MKNHRSIALPTIAALTLLEPALDANYETIKESAYSWKAED